MYVCPVFFSPFPPPPPQLFISELYAYLLDQMHTGMSQVLSLESTPQAPPSFTNAALLRLFAAEAEVYGDLTLADHYHRQVRMCSYCTYVKRVGMLPSVIALLPNICMMYV